MSRYTTTQTMIGLSFTAFYIAIGLFVAALFLPVFITETKVILGYWVIATGWLGFIGFQFAWYANAFALFAIYFSRKRTLLALALSLLTIVTASQAYLFTEIPYVERSVVIDYGQGFYIWYFSFYFVAASILLRLLANMAVKATIERVEELPIPVVSQPAVAQEVADESNDLTPLATAKTKIIPPPLPLMD